jgi:predicted SprT family Zn-dependent metalloprotease
MESVTPTQEAYDELNHAYYHFNKELFNSILPGALITIVRSKSSKGYFFQEAFSDGETTADEIALNPAYLKSRPLDQALSTLVHEMIHLWQFRFAKPGRGRYHNKEWANKMEELGLMPTSTGSPGGRKTGDRVTHYIIEGGAFAAAAKSLIEDHAFAISWGDRFSQLEGEEGGRGKGIEKQSL